MEIYVSNNPIRRLLTNHIPTSILFFTVLTIFLIVLVRQERFLPTPLRMPPRWLRDLFPVPCVGKCCCEFDAWKKSDKDDKESYSLKNWNVPPGILDLYDKTLKINKRGKIPLTKSPTFCVPSKELTYPTLEKRTSSTQEWLLMGYGSSQEGIFFGGEYGQVKQLQIKTPSRKFHGGQLQPSNVPSDFCCRHLRVISRCFTSPCWIFFFEANKMWISRYGDPSSMCFFVLHRL